MDVTKVSQSILANQLALNCNEQLKFTGYYKRELKQKINLLQPVLIKAELEEYDKVFTHEESASVQLYDITAAMIAEIADLGLEHFENITHMARAYRKDPKSIEGIVNKINRQS